jgi:opacity protein-like surface antigen
MKTKRMFLMGSLCAAALTAATLAEAADEVVVEGATTTETTVTTETKEEDEVKPRGFYGGGSIGGSFFDGPSKGSNIFNDSSADDNGDGVPDAFDVDDIDNENNFMWTVFFGYRLNDWLGAEVGWTDIGGFRARHDADSLYPNDRDSKVSASVDGVEVRLRGSVPLGTDRVSALGGLGLFIFQSDGRKQCSGRISGVTDPCNAGVGGNRAPSALNPSEDSGQALTIAAGLQFKITDNVLLRTEYQHFFEVLDQGVHMVTASVVVGFWDVFGQGNGGGDDFGGVVVE